MTDRFKVGRRDHLTFRGNPSQLRHGWLRLTPAYSVHQVSWLLDRGDSKPVVLDPFCGTGTTALVCAERGIPCDTTDINPFLIWLATAKTRSYRMSDTEAFVAATAAVEGAMQDTTQDFPWVPPLFQIDKWWDPEALAALSRGLQQIRRLDEALPRTATDLLLVSFGRTLLEHAQVSFGHQSMSFREKRREGAAGIPALADMLKHPVAATWSRAVTEIASAAGCRIAEEPRVLLPDARTLHETLPRRNIHA